MKYIGKNNINSVVVEAVATFADGDSITTIADHGTIVNYSGTATPSYMALELTATAGTLWNVEFSDGTLLFLNEGSGHFVKDIEGGVIGVITAADITSFWVASAEVPSMVLLDYTGGVIGGSVENLSYPALNVLNDHPRKVAKATTHSSVLIVKMREASSGIAVFNIDSEGVRVEVLSPELEVLDSYDKNLRGAVDYTQLFTDRGQPNLHDLFFTYEAVVTDHTVRIYLTGSVGASTLASLGVAFIGLHATSFNMAKGVVQSLKDKSVVTELNSGATYVLDRPVVRKFAFTGSLEESEGVHNELLDLFSSIGSNPIPWLLYDNDRWLVYARKETDLSLGFNTYNRVTPNLTLIEVI